LKQAEKIGFIDFWLHYWSHKQETEVSKHLLRFWTNFQRFFRNRQIKTFRGALAPLYPPLTSRHLRLRRVMFQTTHFASGDCSPRCEIYQELRLEIKAGA